MNIHFSQMLWSQFALIHFKIIKATVLQFKMAHLLNFVKFRRWDDIYRSTFTFNCCMRWMFLKSRSLRVTSYELDNTELQIIPLVHPALKLSGDSTPHWHSFNHTITNIATNCTVLYYPTAMCGTSYHVHRYSNIQICCTVNSSAEWKILHCHWSPCPEHAESFVVLRQ